MHYFYPSWTISNPNVLCYLMGIGMEISVYYRVNEKGESIPAMEIIYKKSCLFSVDFDDPQLEEIGRAQSNALGLKHPLNLPDDIINKIQQRRNPNVEKYIR